MVIYIIVWVLANTRRQLAHSYWWQVKEYRIDRMRVFLGTKEGRARMDTHFLALKVLSLLLFFPGFLGIYFMTVVFEALLLIKEVFIRQIRKPETSTRGKNFLKTSGLYLLLSTVALAVYPSIATFIFLDLMSYLIPIVSLTWTQILFNKALKRESEKARKILARVKPQVVGITGSQGKSSTKHLLYHLLSKHYKTVETPLSHNTPFGIVRTINSSLTPDTDFFLSEMGAYKKGEITKLTKIAPPDIAMITGISAQHIALFGSMDNLLDAKYELVQALISNAPVFINTSSKATLPIKNQAFKDGYRVITYALGKVADYSAKITKRTNITQLSLVTPTGKRTFSTNLTVDHLIENLVGAIAVADYLKVPWKKIAKAALSIPTLERAISVSQLSDNVTLINDSYNSTPDGFAAALNELSKCKGKKIVVTAGIPELGGDEHAIHKNLARKMKGIDTVLLTTRELVGAFESGVDSSTSIILTSPLSFAKEIKKHIGGQTVILAEGRLPAKIMKDISNI